MTAPEKCPYCGSNHSSGTTPESLKIGARWVCGTYTTARGESLLSNARVQFLTRAAQCYANECDALRARVAELEARLAASVPREVATAGAAILGAATWEVSEAVLDGGRLRPNIGEFDEAIDTTPTKTEFVSVQVWTERASRALARAEAEHARKGKSDG